MCRVRSSAGAATRSRAHGLVNREARRRHPPVARDRVSRARARATRCGLRDRFHGRGSRSRLRALCQRADRRRQPTVVRIPQGFPPEAGSRQRGGRVLDAKGHCRAAQGALRTTEPGRADGRSRSRRARLPYRTVECGYALRLLMGPFVPVRQRQPGARVAAAVPGRRRAVAGDQRGRRRGCGAA